MPYPTAAPATWFVTGTSSGLGLELVRQLLQRGDNVAATTRSAERLREALSGVDTERLMPLEVDLTDSAQVHDAVTRTVERFERLDVVVNNAGYGYLAAVEETTDADIQRMLDVQVLGVYRVLRSALPHLREQRSGHIINVSSILGLTAFPGWGLYSAGKFALNAVSEALAAEVADFDIDVSIIEPGYIRTGFLKPESLATSSTPTEAYPAIRAMIQNHLELQGSQLGDPVKAAAAIIETATSGRGPLHQLLGSDSLSFAQAKIEALTSDVDAGRALALTTDHT